MKIFRKNSGPFEHQSDTVFARIAVLKGPIAQLVRAVDSSNGAFVLKGTK